jgi:hypothetical protein
MFFKDNRNAFKAVYRQLVLLCRKLGLFDRELKKTGRCGMAWLTSAALEPSTAIFLRQSSSSSVNPTLRVTW